MSTIVITGASSGIGAALAAHYAGRGARLLLLGRDAVRLERTAAACRAAAAAVDMAAIDVRDPAPMADILRRFDAAHAVDVIVANAGVTSVLAELPLIDTPDEFRRVIETNLFGVYNSIEPLLGPMAARRRGSIGIIGSLAGLRGLPYSPAYSASKAALKALSEALRARLRPHRVSVTLCSLGFVETPLDDSIASPKPFRISPERAARKIAAAIRRRRAHVAFPLPLSAATRGLQLLPPWAADMVLRSIAVAPRPRRP